MHFEVLLAEVKSNDNKTKEVLKELQEIKTFQQFLSDQYEEMKKWLQESAGHIGELQKHNADLSEHLQHQTYQLTHQINLLEQYSRRDCLEFQGIEYKVGESTDNLVIQYAKQTGITISEKDISISHRLARVDPSSDNKVPNIIAKLTSRKIRDAIYKNRSILHRQKKVYITESLSKQNKPLFNICFKYKRANRYKYIWTKNGKTFLKQGDESDVIVISKERDLLQYNITDGVE